MYMYIVYCNVSAVLCDHARRGRSEIIFCTGEDYDMQYDYDISYLSVSNNIHSKRHQNLIPV